jgi:hypothetical protein
MTSKLRARLGQRNEVAEQAGLSEVCVHFHWHDQF